MDWINLTALWQIIVYGLVAGAGLPALFAVGLKALSLGSRTRQPAVAGSGDSEPMVGGNPVGMALASVCFLIVLAAIAGGIYFIVAGS
ncbi:MAG TPA: hypothetical protein VFX16_28375 [Pseudonocardiaceae bacterium]|nr:hypothetical protein [Pseudonocardiaceae bacterium]